VFFLRYFLDQPRIGKTDKSAAPQPEKMRNLLLIVFIGASLTGFLPAEDKAVDLSGIWILDPDKSRVDQTTPALRKIRITGGLATSGDSDADENTAPSAGQIIAQPRDLTIKIVQTAAEVQIMHRFTAAGEEQAIAQIFALDGSQCFNLASDGRGDFVSRSEWKKGKLINSGIGTLTIDGPRMEIHITEEFSMSKNGKKLTIITMRTTRQGSTKLKQEFLRGDESKF